MFARVCVYLGSVYSSFKYVYEFFLYFFLLMNSDQYVILASV